MFEQKSRPKSLNQMRTFEINNNGKYNGQQYPSNTLKNSKYSLVTFLPLTLFGSFRRYILIYFLFSVTIENISIVALQNTISAIYPLIFLILRSLIQEAMKSIKQHNLDNEINSINCIKIVNNKHVKTTWADIEVGDILYISENEMFPADLILLSSSYESGVCYIETSCLDGEKNLKLKSTIQETQIAFQQDINEIYKIQGAPLSSSLQQFEGFILLPNGSQKALNEKVLLLRGAFLKNTEWIIGVVAYTGTDTKIIRNTETPKNKPIVIEAKMNKLILGILGILNLQVMLFMFSVMLCSLWFYSQSCDHPYAFSTWNHSYLKGFSFFMFQLLSNSMLPISLIISVKLIELDLIKLKFFANVQPLTINDKLNKVEYIFTDKTGTLTSNRLTLKYCIIGDILYGQQPNQAVTPPNNDNQIRDSDHHAFKHSVFSFQDHLLTGIIENHPDYQQLSDQKRQYKIQSIDQTISLELKTQQQLVHEYLMLLSSTHECIAQKSKDGQINYEGPSPDEIALVDAAKNLGYIFEGQSASQLNFTILRKQKQVELLNCFEFDSGRKRTSVIIKDNGIYKLYIKGADSIIKQRLQQEQPFFEFIQNKLTEFSSIGLRTLLVAMKIISEQEYQEFDKQLQALTSSDKREYEKEKLIDVLEKDLYLLGATAVEDRLQDDVPKTIEKLLNANIKVWMLTGDKLDTAENIARSCQIIQGNFTVIKFSEQDLNALKIKTLDNKATLQLCLKERRKISIIVEGYTLRLLTGDPLLQREFVKMALDCDSVVCCRVVPMQKAEVVHLVKEQNKITLAIGDGADDVNMLKEADIGVGLYGIEGMRAVQSSDFALKEFRFLQELLHNHRNVKNRKE